MALRRLALHRVLHRPILLKQGEREPVLCVLLLAATLASRMVLACWIAAAVILLAGIPACRFLAKRDPHFFAVFRRAHRYQRVYPPRSRPYRVNPDPHTGRTALRAMAAVLAALVAAWWFT